MEKVLNLDNFDNTVRPNDDFNKYVNGNWMINNPIPKKYSKWGSFEELHEENLKRLKSIIGEVDDNDCDFL